MSAITERLAAAVANHYRIERHLGAGGMATVYLAEDLKHKRKVALKVLKPELAAVLGAERFVQEITTTASLSHPHILPLFDSSTADGFLYYVMPFIDGETLRDKLSRETQLGINEAVKIASEVADALDYAHRHGVIHRDIKPENILLHDGRPMVADFGIALAVSAAAGGRMTETGLSLGTPHYMSPEQATAEKELTNRSDIYSLGSVLFEMLAGSPPHVGASAQQIIMKIVTEEAQPVTALRKTVPPNVAAAVAKSLEKLPADRFESAKAFAEALANPTFTTASPAVPPGTGTAGPPVRRTAVTAIFAATTVISTAVAAWSLFHRPAPSAVAWYEMALPEPLAQAPNIPILGMSPDGNRIVYVSPNREAGGVALWVRERTSLNGQALAGTAGAVHPVVSPDGQSVAFVSGSPARLRTLPLAGGPATVVLDSTVPVNGFAWGDDGYLYLGQDDGLARVRATGGRLETVLVFAPTDSARTAWWPEVLPGSKVILFTEQSEGERHIVALDTKTGRRRAVASGMYAKYSTSGHLLVTTAQGTLMAARFNAGDLSSGTPVPIVEGLRVGPANYADLVIGAGGRLVYVAGPSPTDPVDEAVWVARDGAVTPVDSGWRLSSLGNSGWAVSPDGTRLAIKLNGESGQDIWIKDLRGGALQRVTFEKADDYRPRWSPDGRSITFISERAGGGRSDVFEQRADGIGTARLLWHLPHSILEAQWSPDGKWLLARASGSSAVGSGGRDVWGKPMTGDTSAVPLLVGPADDRAIAISPDSRWLAYVSDASGNNEVYIRPFPDVNAGQWQVSNGGGAAPLWARSGKELFYVNSSFGLVAADLSRGPSQIGERKVLFSLAGYRLSTNYTWFDIHPDDQRFLMVRESPNNGRLIVAENFFAELEAKVGR